MVREIPGFYYDPEKKKYFKIQPNHAVPSAAKHTHQAVAARKELSKKLQVEAAWSKRLSQGRVATSKPLRRPESSFSLTRSLGYTQRQPVGSVGESVASYYGATLSRGILFHGTGHASTFQNFTFDGTGRFFSDLSCPGHCYISHSSFRPHPSPDGVLQLDANTCIAELHGSVLSIASAGELVIWANSARNQSTQCALAYRFHDGSNLYQLVTETLPYVDIWDLAGSPQGRSVAAASTNGVVVFTSIREHSLNTTTNFTLPETMTVSYKDENVILAGQRSGIIALCDLRTHQSIRNRIQHGSCVTGLRVLSDDRYIIVRGSQHGKMSIYDLRYTPLVETARRTSQTYMDFPGAELPDRRGLGFDYDPTLNIVATAHSEARPNKNCVSLFSTKTGQAVASPLSKHRFRWPVSCIRFANVRSGIVDGKIDPNIGPKGIFTASCDTLDVWTPEGCGVENDEQE